MTDIKIKQGEVVTIELPGLHAIRIDTIARTIAVDGISGRAHEPCLPDYELLDLQHGTYGGFHRLKPADECFDPDCARRGEHDPARTIAERRSAS